MIVSGIPCYLGYLWVIWEQAKQGWHDKIASTRDVPDSEHPVEKWPG